MIGGPTTRNPEGVRICENTVFLASPAIGPDGLICHARPSLGGGRSTAARQ